MEFNLAHLGGSRRDQNSLHASIRSRIVCATYISSTDAAKLFAYIYANYQCKINGHSDVNSSMSERASHKCCENYQRMSFSTCHGTVSRLAKALTNSSSVCAFSEVKNAEFIA